MKKKRFLALLATVVFVAVALGIVAFTKSDTSVSKRKTELTQGVAKWKNEILAISEPSPHSVRTDPAIKRSFRF
jgi:hypothetical protein